MTHSEKRAWDREKLLSEAVASQHEESYLSLGKVGAHKMGVGVRLEESTPIFFFEVVVNLFPSSPNVDLDAINEGLKVLRALKARGYSLTRQDDGSVTCDSQVDPKILESEADTLVEILAKA